jgi:glycine cleavage system aminomethyltransferase T
MNRTQASIWNLGIEPVQLPEFNGFTDVTDATVFLALFGRQAFSIAEKMTALDFMDQAKAPPFLLQGPCCHVPCQVVTLAKSADMSGGLLLTCSRGYAQSMVHAILDAGAEYGLKPAGEARFTDWLRSLA